MKSFAALLGKYLAAFDGQTEFEMDYFFELQSLIQRTTLDELITEYNKLTKQKLWYSTVVSLFSDEFLRRISEATFMISVTWVDNPDGTVGAIGPVYAQVGYEESYMVLGPDDLPVRITDNIRSYSLTNSSFLPNDEIIVQRILLGDVSVKLSIESDLVTIQEIFNPTDPMGRHIIHRATPRMETRAAQIIDFDDFDRIRTAMKGIRTGDFQIIEQPIVPVGD